MLKALLTTIALASLALAAAPPAVPTRQLDAELAAVVATPGHELASLSVLAVRRGRVVYHRQFGDRWIDPAGPAGNRKADGQTLYRIASISKLVTTLGVLRLVEQGRLELDRDLGDYLGFPLRNPHFPAVPVTLRQLLSHRSSLRDEAGYYWDAASGITLADVLRPGGRAYGDGRMWSAQAPPGAWFQYANLPWGVVGTVMERVTGERFDRLMRRLVLEPMGLRGGFHPADFNDPELASMATLYRKRRELDGKEIWEPKGPWIAQVDDYSAGRPQPRALPDYQPGNNGTLFGPQGNCRLSAEGLGRILLILMDGGVSGGHRILRRSSVELMLSVQWRADGGNGETGGETPAGRPKQLMNAWGLGAQHFLDRSGPGTGDRLVEPGGFRAVGHMGDAWGLTSALVFDRKSRNGMVFLIGGVASDPAAQPGLYSGMGRSEERVLTALYRRAILGRTAEVGRPPAPR
jgi:CubicO group peptidase (beta-lactamase class C family)